MFLKRLHSNGRESSFKYIDIVDKDREYETGDLSRLMENRDSSCSTWDHLKKNSNSELINLKDDT